MIKLGLKPFVDALWTLIAVLVILGMFALAVWGQGPDKERMEVEDNELVVLSMEKASTWIAVRPWLLQTVERAAATINPETGEVESVKHICVFYSGEIPLDPTVKKRICVIDAFYNQDYRPGRKRFEIIVKGNVPPPDPGDDDDDDDDDDDFDCAKIPTDQFDNIGRRSCQWVSLVDRGGRDRAIPLSKVYLDVAKDIKSLKIKRKVDAEAYLLENLPAAWNGEQEKWVPFVDEIRKDMRSRGTIGIRDIGRYYHALGLGLQQAGRKYMQEELSGV